MNNLTLGGRLTKEPELSLTQDSQNAYTRNTIAVKRRFKKDTTDFINFTIWGKDAEFLVNYGKKGDYVVITGELHVDKYEDNEGMKRTRTEVLANSVEIISTKQDEVEPKEPVKDYSEPKQEQEPAVDTSGIPDDDLPF